MESSNGNRGVRVSEWNEWVAAIGDGRKDERSARAISHDASLECSICKGDGEYCVLWDSGVHWGWKDKRQMVLQGIYYANSKFLDPTWKRLGNFILDQFSQEEVALVVLERV